MTKDELSSVLRYEPSTGVFTWIVSRGMRCAGAIAGTRRPDGAIQIGVYGVIHLAHRLAWLYMTGAWPTLEIDHRNGDNSDNRWDNLRDVSNVVNQQNQRRAHRDNRVGLLGVRWHDGAYEARIKAETQRYLGRFSTPELAYEAYVKAKRELHIGGTL